MGMLSSKLRNGENNYLMFWCPGCKGIHAISYGQGKWSWNGDVNKPTFTPSVLVTNGHFTSDYKKGDRCWCTYNAEHPDEEHPFTCQRCHSFVTDGKIQFLNDCSHELAGQTVDLPDIPRNYKEE